MGGHRNDGGTRGWKALRAACPVCKRDTATGFDYSHRLAADPLTGAYRLIKRHVSSPGVICAGVGRTVPTSSCRHPDKR